MELTPEEQVLFDESQGIPTDGEKTALATESAPPPNENNQANQQQPTQQLEEFEFTWNGKPVKADRAKTLQWASQGYDYAQKMSEIKRTQAEIAQQKQEMEKRFSPYSQVDEYARTNPQWWSHVQAQWEQRDNQEQAATNPEFQSLRNELKQLNEFKTKFEQQTQQAQIQAEDEALEKELQTVRQEYPNLDWNSLDETGQNLEFRVLNHATKNGINSFRAAFRDYNHENLLKLAAEKAKEEVGKNIQQRTKNGLFGKSQTPLQGHTPANDRGKSDAQLRAEAIEMYNQGLS